MNRETKNSMKGIIMKKKIFISIGLGLLVILIGATVVIFPAVRFMTQQDTVSIDPSLTLMLGGGGNSGIIQGDSAVVVIDTKMMGASEDLYKFAKEKAGLKSIIVINTHYHGDHVKGNKYFKGSRIYIGSYEKGFLNKNIDAENQPTDFVKDSLLIDLGSEKVHLYNLGQAHTFNDLVIYLSNHNVLFTGDLIFNKINPVLKEESGARVSQWIHVLDTILRRWGESKIIPGHGQVGNKEMVISLRKYFVDMTEAAIDSNKENELKDKYKDWSTFPGMASPDKTIEYIKRHAAKK
jgi:glyoxylase-like metal-dependent hydrolase (beta-lactamase superfamily II)